MELAKKCPFLKRVPSAFMRKSGPSLISYAEKCPVMSQVLCARVAAPDEAEKPAEIGRLMYDFCPYKQINSGCTVLFPKFTGLVEHESNNDEIKITFFALKSLKKTFLPRRNLRN